MSVPEVKLCAGAWGFREYDLPAYFEAAASLGLKYVEVNVTTNPAVKHLKPPLTEADIRKMLDAAEKAGVRVVAFALSNDFTSRDPERLRTQMEQLKHLVEMGALAGIEVCRVFAGFGPARYHIPTAIYNQVAEQLRILGEHAAAHNQIIAVENHGGVSATAAQVRRLIETAGSPAVKANYDPANFVHYKEDPLSAWLTLREYAGYTHWKDIRLVDDTPEYCSLGDGVTDWEPVIHAMLRDGYSGYWTLEYEEPADVIEGTQKCINVIQNSAARYDKAIHRSA